ncbi:MAG: uracil-DNA glycosylase [Burkholderiaceae bacterium]|nr:uracil-DNA glycosylase [Burkholderiaceae bacterium]
MKAKTVMTATTIPAPILDALALAHPSWRDALEAGLQAVAQADAAYLPALAADEFLPNGGRLFAAFSQPLPEVRYVLVGEGPYPRADSATGYCFMDGAVGELWAESGLSKKVNRATSLRNFIKMLLVADGRLPVEKTSGNALAPLAAEALADGSTMIKTLPELQRNLHRHGFLLLNATLAYRPHVPPAKEAKAWQPLVEAVLQALARREGEQPLLVLWGKIAERLAAMPAAAHLPQVASEHPYNLSFIGNGTMQALFGPLALLQRAK